MKKFLRLDLPAFEKEVPSELDAMILAHAAIRAKSYRRKKMLLKALFPISAIGAAAAVAIVSLTPATAVHYPSEYEQEPTRIAEISQPKHPVSSPQQDQMIASQAVDSVSLVKNSDMLALADTSALEQECYNLAIMSDYNFDSDNISI